MLQTHGVIPALAVDKLSNQLEMRRPHLALARSSAQAPLRIEERQRTALSLAVPDFHKWAGSSALALTDSGVPIEKIVHAAGVLNIKSLSQQSPTAFDAGFQPKACASYQLSMQSAGTALSSLVTFSSTASVLGLASKSEYSISNGYLNALAAFRGMQSLGGAQSCWGLVAMGMGADAAEGGISAISASLFGTIFCETVHKVRSPQSICIFDTPTVLHMQEILGVRFPMLRTITEEKTRTSHSKVSAQRRAAAVVMPVVSETAPALVDDALGLTIDSLYAKAYCTTSTMETGLGFLQTASLHSTCSNRYNSSFKRLCRQVHQRGIFKDFIACPAVVPEPTAVELVQLAPRKTQQAESYQHMSTARLRRIGKKRFATESSNNSTVVRFRGIRDTSFVSPQNSRRAYATQAGNLYAKPAVDFWPCPRVFSRRLFAWVRRAHPLLKQLSIQGASVRAEGSLTPQSLLLYQDHRVNGQVLLPGMSHVAFMAAVHLAISASGLGNLSHASICGLLFERPFFLTAAASDDHEVHTEIVVCRADEVTGKASQSNRGANFDIADSKGRTPLHFATMTNQLPCLRFLIDQGANIDAVDIEQETPIHYAVRQAHHKCLEELVEAGGRLDLVNRFGETLADIARETEDDDMMDFLNVSSVEDKVHMKLF
jgi:hypothetical protein